MIGCMCVVLFVVFGLMMVVLVFVGVDLIVVGQFDGYGGDLVYCMFGLLENNVLGNLFGGLGLGLVYVGCNIFFVLFDCGFNVVVYDVLVDDIILYIDCFQMLCMMLEFSVLGVVLLFMLLLWLCDIMLLVDFFLFYYGDGVVVNLFNGWFVLNWLFCNYFIGCLDNVVLGLLFGLLFNVWLDLEGICVSVDGELVYVFDEYGLYIYCFDCCSGVCIMVYCLFVMLGVVYIVFIGDVEIDGNISGCLVNKGMEGLVILLDGCMFIGIMQSLLLQDGGKKGVIMCIVQLDLVIGCMCQYVYLLINVGSVSKFKYIIVSEIVVINDYEFLVDECDGKGFGDGSSVSFKYLMCIDFSYVQEVSQFSGVDVLVVVVVSKQDFFDLVVVFGVYGFLFEVILVKIEGVVFGFDVMCDGCVVYMLFVVNDNDFFFMVIDDVYLQGVDNFNCFFVFGFDDVDLLGYQLQCFICVYGWGYDFGCDDECCYGE